MERDNSFASLDVPDPHEVICVCRGITRGQIQAAIVQQHVGTVAELGHLLGAGAECGSCTPALRELLGDSPWTEVTPHFHVASSDPSDPARAVQVDLQLPEDARYPDSFSGQHLTLQGLINGRWVSRTYTIVHPGKHTNQISIAVRRVPQGQFSAWLLDNPDAPKRIRVSEPLGVAHWSNYSRNTVCFVGGIGVTLARSLLEQLPVGLRFHLDYSSRSQADQVFRAELQALADHNQSLTLNFRNDQADGLITAQHVADTVARFPTANYVLCGPPPYVAAVQAGLRQARVPKRRVHVERFFIAQSMPKPRPRWKRLGYSIAGVLALLPALWLLPTLQDSVPHHGHNVGHEKLDCGDCHRDAPGTLRQQLQAKLDYALGRREVTAPFMFSPVDNRQCLDCHRRKDDRHPTHRFLEPRFADVRATLAPQRCASCHREHEQVRVTLPDIGFCVACHKDLEIKKDRISPTHAALIKAADWSSCLGCHDFHNNHNWKEPEQSINAARPQQIRDYFGTGKSPYGEPRVKAKQKEAKQP